MPDWPNPGTITESVATLTEQLEASENFNEILLESLADVEFANEDRGWVRLGAELQTQLTRQGLGTISTNCRVMAVASPLIKRGLLLRAAYVWGQGVEVSARDEDINTVVQDTMSDPANEASLFGSQAQEELERALGTDGNLCIAAFTSPVTGKVQFRSTPFAEVQDVITNPEDRDEPWFYLRQFEVTVVEAGYAGTRTRRVTKRVYHPAMGYWPVQRPRSIDGIEVRWDAPILHVSVNRLDGAKWGIPDAFAAISWARAYEGFLTDWARLMRALSKFAWRLSGDKSSKAQAAAAKIRNAVNTGNLPNPGAPGNLPGPVGAVAASGPGTTLEAIPKTGATIDADSGRPLGAMVAAALGLPVTTLLADPGISGARATAETLDKPTVLEMGMRRSLWTWVYTTVLNYVVLQAVKAPSGPLRATVAYDELGRQVVAFPDEVDTTIEVNWPKLDDLDPKTLVEAIAKADETGKMPPLETMKLLLRALAVGDIDELVEATTDADGNWIDPDLTAAQVAIDAQRAGRDPAGTIR